MSEARESLISRILDAVVTGSGLLVGFAAFFIGLSVTYDVVVRTLFGTTTTGVTDVNTYIMGFITFFGAGFALREDAHVSVDIVTSRFGAGTGRVLSALSDLVVLLVTAVILWLAFEFWWDAFVSGERSWGLFTVELWIPYLSFPVGMALLLAVQIRRVLRFWHGTMTR